ncbi:MAG: 8-amino-7-oxononanoate synthase [Verrucomicrobia bacterium]|nr:8-amino-7-oxononanoate synthase [Verrucomicrobiota bacterium]
MTAREKRSQYKSIDSFEDFLDSAAAEIRSAGLWRRLKRIDSPQGTRIKTSIGDLLNFSSNDYLGLANHEAIKAAATEVLERYGVGSGASRLISGSLAPIHGLEQRLADWKSTESAVVFGSGFAAAIGTIPALAGKNDLVILDKLAHACLFQGAFTSGAQVRVFPHNDLDRLEDILRRRAAASSVNNRRTLIVTESVFSMDGDQAPIKKLIELKEKYGAWLMIDEAHAAGMFGVNRSGLVEAMSLTDAVEVQMGTLSKAVGAVGGYICGSNGLINILINRAKSFIFSTAPSPATVAAASKAVDIIKSSEGEHRVRRLWENVIAAAGILMERPEYFNLPRHVTGAAEGVSSPSSAIIPAIIGETNKTMESSRQLRERGIYIPAIRYPTVPRNQARLRITLSALHRADDLESLRNAVHALDL